jgi:hypothetical protein
MKRDGHDPFQFSIDLSDHDNLQSKTTLLCVRYRVNEQEHCHNNLGKISWLFISSETCQIYAILSRISDQYCTYGEARLPIDAACDIRLQSHCT